MRINISAAAALLAVPAALAFQPTALRLPVMTSKSSSVVRAAPSSSVMLKSNKFAPLLMSASDDAAAEEELESPAPTTTGGGTASIPNEVFNLVKSIVGAGVLSLPAGIAAFGNAPSAIIPAVALICIIGGFSAYGFSLIGRVCSYTGGQSYRGAWSESVGEETSWIPAVTCTFKTCFAVLSYSMILGDTIRALLMTAGVETTRTLALLGVTGTTLLPLCLLKNLSSLAPFSLVGIAGMFYTAIAMIIRYLGGSYKLGTAAVRGSKAAAVPAGKYLADVAANYQPQFGNLGASAALSPNVFILICMLSTAYMAHFNAPKFFIELKDNTIKRYNTVVGTSFGISVFLFALIGSLGFLTFGSASSGLILNNYAGSDALMSLSRIAVAISIIFSFPLAFVGARDGWLDLLKVPMDKRTDSVLTKTTLAILSGITFAATQLKELAFIMSFAGATLGNALIYIYPSLMFRSAVKKMGDKASKGLKREVPFAMFSALLGVGMGCVGAKMAFGLL
jgi:amino acid permease